MIAHAPQVPNTHERSSTRDLSAELIAKAYRGVHAVSGVSVVFRAGEVHGLIGENGAGKSTLIKILTGAETADSGELRLGGEKVDFSSTAQARRSGVVALYQEQSIVPTISVAENILLGSPATGRAGFVDRRVSRARATARLAQLGQTGIDPDAIAGNLSPVSKTMVAIARALEAEARVIFFDEPTASLTDSETESLYAVIRTLRERGIAIVYVSHRLEEVFTLCDAVTVMRNGQVVTSVPISELTIDTAITAMVGRAQGQLFPPRAPLSGVVAASIRRVSGRRVRDISFDVRAGEVLGIAGLAGSGRSELLRILGGAQHATSGSLALKGEPAPELPRSVAHALRRGIALVPEERRTQGVIEGQSVTDNLILGNLGLVSALGFVRAAGIRAVVAAAVARFGIKISQPAQAVSELSGGNQQKVVIAKQLVVSRRLLLLDEPTRGVDVGAKEDIYALIRSLTRQGMAVIAASSEIHELLGFCDRIAVLHEGRLAALVNAADSDVDTILRHCYGRSDS